MPSEYEVKLRKVAKTFVVTIPKSAIAGLDWKEGDKLTLTVNDHVIVKKGHAKRETAG